MNEDKNGRTPETDPEWEDPDREDLEDFFFYKKLEENDGKPTRGMAASGCFFILPLAALLAGILFFLMNKLY